MPSSGPALLSAPTSSDAQAHRAAELGHRLLGRGVPPQMQQVALDRVLGVGQLVGGDVVERRRPRSPPAAAPAPPRPRSRPAGGVKRRGPPKVSGTTVLITTLPRHALAHLGQRVARARWPAARSRRPRRGAAASALEWPMIGDRVRRVAQLGGLGLGALGVARADDDRVAELAPSGRPGRRLPCPCRRGSRCSRALSVIERGRAPDRAAAASSLPRSAPAAARARWRRECGRACP